MYGSLPLVLASASPRRSEILVARGFAPIVRPSYAEERIPEDRELSPEETAMFLAEQKAQTIADELLAEAGAAPCLVLGVDTIVFRDCIIGKPKDERDALAILRRLADGMHAVISGVCLIELAPPPAVGGLSGRPSALIQTDKRLLYETTLVTFEDYTDEEILAYVRANPPYDKSGSYAIQSDWGKHALRIDGSVENVIGLPIQKIEPLLAARGVVRAVPPETGGNEGQRP